MNSIEQRTIDTLRVLSMDAIDRANSGHPGLPLGAAPMAYTLWAKELKINPEDPQWYNRDRFILSAGHGSALLYSLLHLFGYGVSTEDLKNFRQLGSNTPGHPEYGHTPGVETTTGPLGAGIATAVGFAMAETRLAAQYNRPGHELIDHHTYVLCGDGDLMEGISNEAASLAGTLKLGKLIVLYDSNKISIEGDTQHYFSENVVRRYEAMGWHVLTVENGAKVWPINQAIQTAKEEDERPTLIVVKTTIGYGSPKAGTADVHGSPLGAEGTQKTKEALGYPDTEAFEVTAEVKEHMAALLEEKKKAYHREKELEASYRKEYPQEWQALTAAINGQEDLSFLDEDEYLAPLEKDMATRASGGVAMNRIAEKLPNLFGGSADLTPSTKTNLKNTGQYRPDDRLGGNINFGVREHAMAAIINGIQLHGGFRSYGSTFLVFSDYMKPQIRLSALMGAPVSYVFTHDSIGVGEDGPTHQPIEQLTMLRSIPNLITFRPADGAEVLAAWAVAMKSKSSPVALVLSRQTLPELEATSQEARRGGYILRDPENFQGILLATGSEVHLALEAAELLSQEGMEFRVVSMPSMELFEAQPMSYQEKVLPENCKFRVSLEAGHTMPWYRYIGREGLALGIDSFGASGPGDAVFAEFGFTPEKVAQRILGMKEHLEK
ncbi:MAG: transketolase [Tissierellia bacterium]|nr:transketolase [Tissierellia bacterium]